MALHRLHRFFYSTSFTLLFLLLFLLLLITPADAVVQAYFRNRQLYNVFVIAGTYVLTAALALVIYVSRIYSVRRLMEEIPKPYAPIKKMDLPKRVHKAIAGNLSRSAIIAVQSRPVGAKVSHPGWSSPGSADLPEVQYAAVIAELPHLIEAKAVSLQVLGGAMLGRQQHMTLRAYLVWLAELGYVRSGAADSFLEGYERARWRTSGEGVEEGEFRGLMKVFARLLRGMGMTPDISIQDEDEGWGTGDEVDKEMEGDGTYSGDEGSVMRRGFGYMSLGYETTTTDYGDEEEDGLRYTPERYDEPKSGQRVFNSERDRSIDSRDRFVERERDRIRGSLAGAMRQRSGTTTTIGTASTGTRDGEAYGIEMVPLSRERTRARRRLSVRVSTGTFG